MKKSKIVLYHVLVFLAGAFGIGSYFFYTIKNLPPEAAVAGIALLPVGVVYVIGFGLLCLCSMLVFLTVSVIRNFLQKRRTSKSVIVK